MDKILQWVTVFAVILFMIGVSGMDAPNNHISILCIILAEIWFLLLFLIVSRYNESNEENEDVQHESV